MTSRPLTVLVVLLAAIAGCGGDNEAAEAPPPLPDLTVPQTDTEESTGTQTAPPVTETTPPVPEPAPTPPPETLPDSPENDTPPPPDSPAERFEEFCSENPGACG